MQHPGVAVGTAAEQGEKQGDREDSHTVRIYIRLLNYVLTDNP